MVVIRADTEKQEFSLPTFGKENDLEFAAEATEGYG